VGFERVLITGTTSGLGFAFLQHYYDRCEKVIAINRRRDEHLEEKFPNADFYTLDISDFQSVLKLMVNLERSDNTPDLLVLNAGVNQADNLGFLNFEMYEKVLRTNILGVMTFISALGRLSWKGKTIFTLSSTSNIVPNPAHLSYEHSKICLDRAVDSFQKSDPHNSYKTVILGPVRTNISNGFPEPTGIKKKIFDHLAIESTQAVKAIAHFLQGSGRRLYYTKLSCAFYYLVKLALKFMPSLYTGTEPNPILKPENT